MFDTVVLEGLKLKVPVEIKEFLGENGASFPQDFQTKDLDNSLLTYYIKESGQVYETEFIPTGKKIKSDYNFPSFKTNRSFIERLYFDRVFKPLGPRIIDERKEVKKRSSFTETIAIYTYTKVNDRYLELEYELEIVSGKVKKSKVLKWSIESEEDAIERRERDQKWNEEQDIKQRQREIFTQKWYYPILREVYNPIVYFGSRAVVSICNKIIHLTYSWRGV